MIARNVLSLLAIILWITLTTATQNDLENADSSNNVKNGTDDSSVEIKVHRRRPRLLNIPKGVHPFCKRVVGTVQQAPKICNGVSSFIVDATTSACSESFREICRLAIGTSYGCQPIIKKICPSRDAVEKKIKQAVNKSCENSVQKVINQFGKVTSDVNKNAVCDAFVEVVREVCHKTITKFCDDLRSLFQTPCTDFLPGIICD